MERRINNKIDTYITSFKDDIRNKSTNLGIVGDQVNNLIQYIYDYERLSFGKDDFLKRKRVKNVVPFFDRCCAKRANGEQCTRRKKEDNPHCGTHMKGTPHGVIADETNEPQITTQKIEVWAQDILGIVYYIDKNGNVYQAEDIISSKINPKIIAKYVKTELPNQVEVYTIPEFNLV